MFNFFPEFALRFYAAVRAQDCTTVYDLLRIFVIPYLNIRDRKNGYAVSVVEAGLTAIGRDGGPVRPPLIGLSASETEELATLIARVSDADALVRSA